MVYVWFQRPHDLCTLVKKSVANRQTHPFLSVQMICDPIFLRINVSDHCDHSLLNICEPRLRSVNTTLAIIFPLTSILLMRIGSFIPPCTMQRCPTGRAPSNLTVYGCSCNIAPRTRVVRSSTAVNSQLRTSRIAPGPGRRSGRAFSYSV